MNDIERFYEIVNRVQMKLKEANVFISDDKMIPVAENIMTDAGVKFSREKDVDRCYYHVSPADKTIDSEMILDEINDEELDILFLNEN